MNLILCGYKNCGKTTIGSAFAKAYGYRFIDTDELLCDKFNTAENTQYTVSEIHQQLGETAFRNFEKTVVHGITATANTIIATGGGVLIQPENQRHLHTLGDIIYLYVQPEILKARFLQKPSLPNFIRAEFIEADFSTYLNSRKSLYENATHHVLDITHKSVDECVLLLNHFRGQHGQ